MLCCKVSLGIDPLCVGVVRGATTAVPRRGTGADALDPLELAASEFGTTLRKLGISRPPGIYAGRLPIVPTFTVGA